MVQERFQERVNNIVDATSFREPKKVPVGLDYLYWPYGYAGVTLEEVINDPEENAKAYCKFMGDIPFDFTMNVGGYECYDLFEAVGSNNYSLCNDHVTVQHNQSADSFIEPEEYEILIKDPGYFMEEYYLKKKVALFKEPEEVAYEKLKLAAQAAGRCVQTTMRITDLAVNQYGIVPLTSFGGPIRRNWTVENDPYGVQAPMFISPLDTIFDTYRGMMGVFEDLIERPEVLDEACDAIAKYNMKFMSQQGQQLESNPLPMAIAIYNIAPFLSPEQYERYWFRAFKQVLLPYAEAGKKIYIKGEGSFMHTIERLKEFPKGSLVVQLDMDDPYEVYEKIGGYHTIATGVRTAMFALNDIQKCKDHIKKAFDTFAPGGGFMFYQDKPFMSPSDASVEAVREIWGFANECAEGKR